MFIRRTTMLLLSLALSASPLVVKGADWLKFSADIFHSDEDGNFRPRLGLDLNAPSIETDEVTNRYGTFSAFGDAKAELRALIGGGLSLEPSVVQAHMGGQWAWRRGNSEGSASNIDVDAVIEGTSRTPSSGVNLGTFQLAGSGRIETDQTFENVNLCGGAELTYVLAGAFKNSVFRPPRFGAAYELVKPTASDARDQLGVDDSAFPRFRAFVLWGLPIGRILAPPESRLSRVGLDIHWQYFKEEDQPAVWRAEDKDEYNLFEARLGYRVKPETRQWYAPSVYSIGYSRGRALDYEEDDRRVLIGLQWE